MNTAYHTQARIHDQARDDADILRREAISDFWRGADAALAAARNAAGRSARRLARRLARRMPGERIHSPSLSSDV